MCLKYPTNLNSVKISLILILIFINFLSKTVGSNASSLPTILDINHPAKICGSVNLSSGKTVTLTEGVTLTTEQFKLVRNITLNKTLFSPVSQCAIQICGYMSQGTLIQEGYIGSTTDWMKCKQFATRKHGDDFFRHPFYTSSLSCGCKSPASICNGKCNDARSKIWTGNACAVLFEEINCNNCYFPGIKLSKNENYTTSNSHHITSLIVRPSCKVLHYAPAMKRVHWFKDEVQPLVFDYIPEKEHDRILSPYQPEAETFHCICQDEDDDQVKPLVSFASEPSEKRDPVGTRDPTGKRDSVLKLEGQSDKLGIGSWSTGIGASIAVLLSVVVIGIYFLRRKLNWCGNGNHNLMTGVTMSPEPELSLNDDLENAPLEQIEAPTILGTGNKLEEKLDDVKKLLELLCGGGGGGSSVRIPNQAFANVHKNVKQIAEVKDQFKSVCNSENIVQRDKILFNIKGKCVGEGQFGKVYKGILKNELDGLKDVVAVKLVEWVGCRDEHVKSFLREIKMYQDVGSGSEYIVKLLGACVDEDGLFILTQFCEGGSLKDYLLNKLRPKVYLEPEVVTAKEKQLGDGYSCSAIPVISKTEVIWRRDEMVERELIRFSEQICCGMEWLSGKGIIHGDLAVRNVLLSLAVDSAEKTAKICDFGMSKKCIGPGREYIVENLGYRHPKPEVMEDEEMWTKLMECWAEEPEKRPSFMELSNYFKEKNL